MTWHYVNYEYFGIREKREAFCRFLEALRARKTHFLESRVRIELTTVAFTVARLCPCATTALFLLINKKSAYTQIRNFKTKFKVTLLLVENIKNKMRFHLLHLTKYLSQVPVANIREHRWQRAARATTCI